MSQSNTSHSTVKSRRNKSARRQPAISPLIDEALKSRQTQQRKYRQSLTLTKHPITTLSLFVDVAFKYSKQLISNIISHPLSIILLSPVFAIAIIHFLLPMFQTPFIETSYIIIEWVAWWLLLGVLSSIGLGTGMHSGLLFLFPFIGQVCMVAATCHSLDFHTFGDHAFICLTKIEDESQSTVTFWGLFAKVLFPSFLWGAGTALGEIPPYAVSLAAVRAGKEDEFSEMQHELDATDKKNILTKMKLWMIKFLEKYGFWAVLAFAAWPNVFFDMCGIACGHFEMPFWTFFGATFIGKAIIKINGQTMFFITVFNEHTMNQFIDWMEHLGFEWLSKQSEEFFETQRNVILGKLDDGNNDIGGGSDSGSGSGKHTPLFRNIWTLIVSGFIIVFIGSTIQIFARQRQKEIDDENNDKWIKSQEN